MRENLYKKNNGITLIILIITVVILIILAGIIIDYTIDGRIFDNAKEVVNETEEITEEQEKMANDVRDLYR